MSNYIEVDLFSNDQVFLDSKKNLKELTKRLNEDLSEWTMVKVPIKREFIDDLTEICTYEIRYRLYLSTVYSLLGFDDSIANRYIGYWEKDKDGNITNVCFP